MAHDLNKVRQMIDKGEALLFDVRESTEWMDEHLEEALSLPLSDIEDGLYPQGVPADKILYLHCRRGSRAHIAAAIMREDYVSMRRL